MHAAINDIGVYMPDIADRQHGHGSRDIYRAVFFVGFSRLTGFGACGSLCAIHHFGF